MTDTNLEQQDIAYCTDLVRTSHSDAYLAALLLPKPLQDANMVLNAFHVEITNVTLSSPEPLAGEVRLKWWGDVLEGSRDDEANAHPVARALLALIDQRNLPIDPLLTKLDTHIFDLYRDPMETTGQLEGWCGATRSSLFQLSALCAGAEASSLLADACGHSGMVTGILSILENWSWHHARKQIYVPANMLSQHNLTPGTFLADSDERHAAVYADLIELAKTHYGTAIENISKMDGQEATTFLPLSLTPHYLQRAEKRQTDLSKPLPKVSQLRKQWILWRASSQAPYATIR